MAASDASGHLSTDELFRRHADFVARFLSRLGVPSGQLEDALQEVFLVAHKNGGYRPGPARPTSWLASLALRAAARHRRRDGMAKARLSEAPVERVESAAQDPAREAQVRQDLERLHRALQQLPDELSTALWLVEVEGESCVSVAAGLGCPVGTIYWRVHQARKQLRSTLAAAETAPDRRAADAASAQPVRSWMILFGLDRWTGSEASRLLQLAREHPAPALPLDALLARHHALLEAGAELPAWAGSVMPGSASWLTLLGGGPIAVGALGAAIVAVVALSPSSSARDEELAAPVAQTAAADARPASPLALDAPAALDAPDALDAPGTSRPRPEAARAAASDAASVPKPTRSAEPRGHAYNRRREHALDRPDPGPAPETESSASTGAGPSPALETSSAQEPRPGTARSREQARPTTFAEPEAKLDPATAKMARVVSDAELAEMADIARAERLLEDEPARALALTRALQTSYPNSRFKEERSYLVVMALHGLGRASEAREKAATFLRAYPAGLYSDRVRKAIAGEGR